MGSVVPGVANLSVSLEAALTWTSRAVLVCDYAQPDNPIVFANQAFSELTGYELQEIIGRNCRFMQGAETDRQVVAQLREALSAGVSIRREILNYRKNGEPFWNDLSIDPIRNDAGAAIGFVSVQHDCTMLRAAREDKIMAEQRLLDVTRNVPGYVYRRVLKPDGSLELPYVGSSFNTMVGFPDAAIITAAEFYNCVHPDDHDRLVHGIRQSASELSMFQEEFRLVTSQGTVRWVRSYAQARPGSNSDVVWDGLAIDITAEKTSEAELAFLAFHDSLTGLSNRIRFKNSLLKAVETISDDKRTGIFFIDIDQFQEINEALGQSAGDEVLRAIGQKLRAFVEGDVGRVARLGGDEFAVLIPEVSATESIAALASTIAHDLSRPMQIEGRELVVQVCVGAAVFPSSEDRDHSAVADASIELMKQADLALHAAKQDGPGSHRIYAAELDDRVRNRLALRQSLHRAIDEEQFELHYHPLVELRSGRIVGAEALVRWNHPEFGMQRPDLFVPLAETSGLIVPLGAWVMTQAMGQHEAWRCRGLIAPRIAINVSSIQLQKADFRAVVERALATTGANPCAFEFELTEGLMIEPSLEILAVLNWLKSLGFWITVDDFGTGHSTFKYLRDFPVDKIKIDQTFVRQLVIDSSDASIIRAMIGLSRSLGVKIVAEGVETEMQRNFLLSEGCEIGQGYLFSLPLTAEDFGWLIERNIRLPLSTE